jgi:hypothetical protein
VLGGRGGSWELGRAEKPSDGGGIVAERKDALMLVVRVQAFEPHIDYHSDKLQEVVDLCVPKEWARFWNTDLPGSAAEAIATEAKGAGV